MPHYVLRVNPTHGRRRYHHRRRNPTHVQPRKGKIDTPVIVVGALTAGLALFLLSRPSTAAPVPLPTPGPTPGPTPAPGTGQSLDDRLRSSEQARQVWLFQAETYMYGYDSRATPDGVIGPNTTAVIRQVNQDTGFGDSTNWVPDMVRRGRVALQQIQMRETGSDTLGPSPFSIPNRPSPDVLALLEQTSQNVDPGTMLHWA